MALGLVLSDHYYSLTGGCAHAAKLSRAQQSEKSLENVQTINFQLGSPCAHIQFGFDYKFVKPTEVTTYFVACNNCLALSSLPGAA